MGPSFLSLRKEKKQKKLKPSTEGREVFPGTSRIVEGIESLKLLASKYVPGQIWPASLTPWSSFASFLASRQEKALYRGRGSFSGHIENSRKFPIWPASLTPWFSFAFFSCIKARKEDHGARKSCIKRRKEDHEALLDFLMRPSFLSLRKEKKQKKLKPSTEGEEVFPGTSIIVESPQIGRRPWRIDLLLPSFLSIKRRKEGHEVRKACVKTRKEGHEIKLCFLMRPSFLSLRKEKKQKKLKPSTEGEKVFPGTSRIAEGLESLKLLDSKFVRSQMAPR